MLLVLKVLEILDMNSLATEGVPGDSSVGMKNHIHPAAQLKYFGGDGKTDESFLHPTLASDLNVHLKSVLQKKRQGTNYSQQLWKIWN